MLRGMFFSLGPLALALSCLACSDDSVPVADTHRPQEAGIDLGVDQRLGDGPGLDALPSDIGPGSEGPAPTCSAQVETINGQPAGTFTILTSKEDQDLAKAGIQINVVASLIGRPDGTTVQLFVTGLSPKPSATSSGGKATFQGVTVDDKLAVVTIRPEVTGCGSNALVLNVQADPSCSFTTPANGVTLYQKDDKSPGDGIFHYDAKVQTSNASGGQVVLKVNNAQFGSPQTPTVSGLVSFLDAVLPSQAGVTLEATVTKGTLSAKCSVTVDVDTGAPACSIDSLAPAPMKTSKGEDALGPAQDAEPGTVGLQTTVTVKTEPGVNAVTLSINGTPGQALQPTGNQAAFAITLGEGIQTLQAECKNTSTGNTGGSQPYQLLVDTVAPPKPSGFSCTVTDHRGGNVECTFPDVDDGTDGSGVEHYLLRYRQDSAIDGSNFDDVNTTAVAPNPPTSPVQITKLPFKHSYNFAIKAVDYVGNVSDISDASGPAVIDFKEQLIDGIDAAGNFGEQIVMGDFNCDGYSDIAIGEAKALSGQGKVYLYFGSGAGLPDNPSKQIQGTVANGQLGTRVAALNFNGDSQNGHECTDLAVLALVRDGFRGRVYLYLGQSLWTDRVDEPTGPTERGAEIVYQLAGTSAASEKVGFRLGYTDLDGDGAHDLAMLHVDVGTPKTSDLLVDYGEKTLTPIAAGVAPETRVMPAAADLMVTGGSFSASFGFTLARGGLLNADAYEELLIGSLNQAASTGGVGSAYVLLGAARSTSAPPEVLDLSTSSRVLRIDGSASNLGFGASVVGLGDINGDGSAEFAVGDYKKAVGADTQAGEAYVFSLTGQTLPTTAADAVAVISNDFTPAASNKLGRTMANGAEIHPAKGADLNKDGLAEIAVGLSQTAGSTSGSVLIFYGKQGDIADLNLKASAAGDALAPASSTSQYSYAVTFLADVNGDGYVDLLVGDWEYASNLGRVALYY